MYCLLYTLQMLSARDLFLTVKSKALPTINYNSVETKKCDGIAYP